MQRLGGDPAAQRGDRFGRHAATRQRVERLVEREDDAVGSISTASAAPRSVSTVASPCRDTTPSSAPALQRIVRPSSGGSSGSSGGGPSLHAESSSTIGGRRRRKRIPAAMVFRVHGGVRG
jgi:hypothetical protein